MNKRFLVIILILTYLFSATLPAQANDNFIKQPKNFSEELKQKISACKNNKEKELLKRTLKMHEITDAEVKVSIRQYMANKPKPDITLEGDVDVYLGRDCNFYAASAGNHGGSGNYYANFNTSNNRNLVGCWSIGTSSSAWAWVGKSFRVNGTGSQVAFFSIEGYYGAFLQSADYGASTGGIDFKLYDYTADTWVDSAQVAFLYAPASGDANVYNVNYSKPNAFQATLQAGHEYLVLLQTEGYTHLTGTFDSYHETSGEYSDWYRIKVDF
ncbi:hypothetical protein [Moorella sp. Hama-1]|uniref:hypothetical protein n=1 Tax=Moorella sp. Hama-1 TaxID=2138101 RepID=UPI000D643D55|nr:hypothetical protein [Moorella sp. Hama-1]BCV22157.1 hypothetical protein hamaS1_22260 [Moorella sp. Hama-1]